jgi:hypothetical protein
MTGGSLTVVSPFGVESDFFGSFRPSFEIDPDDDFDILVTDDAIDVPDPVDAADIPAEEVRNFILFPAGHPGYNQF